MPTPRKSRTTRKLEERLASSERQLAGLRRLHALAIEVGEDYYTEPLSRSVDEFAAEVDCNDSELIDSLIEDGFMPEDVFPSDVAADFMELSGGPDFDSRTREGR